MGRSDYIGGWYPTARETEAAKHLARNGTWQRNTHVRQVLGDAFADMTPTESDEITDAICWALEMGEPIDHCAIGKALADCVLRHLGVVP